MENRTKTYRVTKSKGRDYVTPSIEQAMKVYNEVKQTIAVYEVETREVIAQRMTKDKLNSQQKTWEAVDYYGNRNNR